VFQKCPGVPRQGLLNAIYLTLQTLGGPTEFFCCSNDSHGNCVLLAHFLARQTKRVGGRAELE
jgi:hypothetical protein